MSEWMCDGKLPDATSKQGSFLFLVGVILNQNISGELAWRGVARLSERIDMRPEVLRKIPVRDFESVLRSAPAIHPFIGAMAQAIIAAAEKVYAEYHGDARLLWRDSGSLADLMARMTRFRQIGGHKAEVAVFLLKEVYAEWDTGTSARMEQVCPALATYLGV